MQTYEKERELKRETIKKKVRGKMRDRMREREKVDEAKRERESKKHSDQSQRQIRAIFFREENSISKQRDDKTDIEKDNIFRDREKENDIIQYINNNMGTWKERSLKSYFAAT